MIWCQIHQENYQDTGRLSGCASPAEVFVKSREVGGSKPWCQFSQTFLRIYPLVNHAFPYDGKSCFSMIIDIGISLMKIDIGMISPFSNTIQHFLVGLTCYR